MHALPCAAGRGYKRTQAGCAPTTSASDLDARIWAIARSLVDCGIYKRIYIDARFPDEQITDDSLPATNGRLI
jgi:hypothetical protein